MLLGGCFIYAWSNGLLRLPGRRMAILVLVETRAAVIINRLRSCRAHDAISGVFAVLLDVLMSKAFNSVLTYV